MGPKRETRAKNTFMKKFLTTKSPETEGWFGLNDDCEQSEDEVSSDQQNGGPNEGQLKFDKFDKQLKAIMKQLRKMSWEMRQMHKEVSSRFGEIEKSIEDTQAEIADLKEERAEVRQQLKVAENQIAKQAIEITALKDKVTNQERYSREFNIRIVGLKEDPKEDCVRLIAKLLSTIPAVNKTEVEIMAEIENAHRIGFKRAKDRS